MTLLVTLLGIMKNTVKLYLFIFAINTMHCHTIVIFPVKFQTAVHISKLVCVHICVCRGLFEFHDFLIILTNVQTLEKLLIALETIATSPLGCSLSLLPVVF